MTVADGICAAILGSHVLEPYSVSTVFFKVNPLQVPLVDILVESAGPRFVLFVTDGRRVAVGGGFALPAAYETDGPVILG